MRNLGVFKSITVYGRMVTQLSSLRELLPGCRSTYLLQSIAFVFISINKLQNTDALLLKGNQTLNYCSFTLSWLRKTGIT